MPSTLTRGRSGTLRRAIYRGAVRIVSYRRDDGAARFGIVDRDAVLDAGDDLAALVPGAAVGTLDDVTLLAPVPRPGKVVCVGRNYAEHAAETGSPVPDKPQLFAKWANAVVGPGVAEHAERPVPGVHERCGGVDDPLQHDR